MKVNFVINSVRSDALEASAQVAAWLLVKGIEVGAEHEPAQKIGTRIVNAEDIGKADLVIAFGGDGTLIYAADLCSAYGTPILGVFYGRFGFVTKCEPTCVYQVLEDFFNAKTLIEERMMVQTELVRRDKVIATLKSLNETVLHRDATGRILTFTIHVDGHYLTSFPADGVLVATPTGSTAYNLSAGGPIVDPRVQAIILTAINPHTLHFRPLVLYEKSTILLSIPQDGNAVLLSDGQKRLHLLSGDTVRLTRSSGVTRLVSTDKFDFLIKLRDRIF